jgi:hypothetical protein
MKVDSPPIGLTRLKPGFRESPLGKLRRGRFAPEAPVSAINEREVEAAASMCVFRVEELDRLVSAILDHERNDDSVPNIEWPLGHLDAASQAVLPRSPSDTQSAAHSGQDRLLTPRSDNATVDAVGVGLADSDRERASSVHCLRRIALRCHRSQVKLHRGVALAFGPGRLKPQCLVRAKDVDSLSAGPRVLTNLELPIGAECRLKP